MIFVLRLTAVFEDAMADIRRHATCESLAVQWILSGWYLSRRIQKGSGCYLMFETRDLTLTPSARQFKVNLLLRLKICDLSLRPEWHNARTLCLHTDSPRHVEILMNDLCVRSFLGVLSDGSCYYFLYFKLCPLYALKNHNVSKFGPSFVVRCRARIEVNLKMFLLVFVSFFRNAYYIYTSNNLYENDVSLVDKCKTF